jgi:hypothetical protein
MRYPPVKNQYSYYYDVIREVDMSEIYDLFIEKKGRLPTWIETVEGLPQLKERLLQLAVLNAGQYLIWDRTRTDFVEPFYIPD